MGINQSHPDDQVDHALSSLQGEVENFVLRMAAEFPQRKEQLIFLINNYDMLLAVLAVRKQVTVRMIDYNQCCYGYTSLCNVASSSCTQ